jgi:hypothetical protein
MGNLEPFTNYCNPVAAGSAALQRRVNAPPSFRFCIPLHLAVECKTHLLALQPNAGLKARTTRLQ